MSRPTLRHFLATLAYRTRKTIIGAPADFGAFEGAGKSPSAILSHMGDLMQWANSWFDEPRWSVANVGAWDENVERFFSQLKQLDDRLATNVPLRRYNEERMLQGPIADAITHVGQLSMLRRMYGAPTSGENFAEAGIQVGDVSGPAVAQRA